MTVTREEANQLVSYRRDQSFVFIDASGGESGHQSQTGSFYVVRLIPN